MIDTVEKLNKEMFEMRILFGHKVIATDLRIDPSILPKGIYKYETRENEEFPYDVVELGKEILVNFEATILSTEPTKLDPYGYRSVDEEKDMKYVSPYGIKFNDYLKVMKKKEVER